jgi:hypothetical protein
VLTKRNQKDTPRTYAPSLSDRHPPRLADEHSHRRRRERKDTRSFRPLPLEDPVGAPANTKKTPATISSPVPSHRARDCRGPTETARARGRSWIAWRGISARRRTNCGPHCSAHRVSRTSRDGLLNLKERVGRRTTGRRRATRERRVVNEHTGGSRHVTRRPVRRLSGRIDRRDDEPENQERHEHPQLHPPPRARAPPRRWRDDTVVRNTLATTSFVDLRVFTHVVHLGRQPRTADRENADKRHEMAPRRP